MFFPLAALMLLADISMAASTAKGNLPILLGYAGARPGEIIGQ
jgi:hypothetical protein